MAGTLSAGVRIAAVFAAAVLAGCGSAPKETPGEIGFVQGYLGGVVADEPRAALTGRDVLSAGGNAVDAAVATYFALAVTLPSSAALGSGGVCLAFDRAKGDVRTLSFPPGQPTAIPAGADRPTAVPGAVRGFYALHARYGRLRWEQLIAPAESLARFGTPVSRALAADLQQVGPALLADPEARRVFSRPGGGLVGEGDPLRQVELAATLGRIRTVGPGDFYAGTLARQLVDGAAAAGGSLAADDLRAYAPEWQDTLAVKFGLKVAHFPSLPAAGGVTAAQMWTRLSAQSGLGGLSDDQRAHLAAETMLRAFADRSRWMSERGRGSGSGADLISADRVRQVFASFDPARHAAAATLDPAPRARQETPAVSGFVAVDRDGSAVACNLTMNNLFGTGRIVRGTGVLLAMEPASGAFLPTSLAPMLVINPIVREVYLAATGSGGLPGLAALVSVAAAALVEELPLDPAMNRARVYDPGMPDLTYYEPTLPPAAVAQLEARGHRMAATRVLGRVNALYCPNGLPPKPETCTARADPRGFGLAAGAE